MGVRQRRSKNSLRTSGTSKTVRSFPSRCVSIKMCSTTLASIGASSSCTSLRIRAGVPMAAADRCEARKAFCSCSLKCLANSLAIVSLPLTEGRNFNRLTLLMADEAKIKTVGLAEARPFHSGTLPMKNFSKCFSSPLYPPPFLKQASTNNMLVKIHPYVL